jgi:propanediol dehydratase small subunit
MSGERLSIADYPLAEKRPEVVRGKRGKDLDEITLEAMLEDRVTLEDLRITSAALRQQAEIAHAAGRDTLAANFERGAELVDVPQDTIMRIYELLRPGRAQSPGGASRGGPGAARPIWSQGHRGVCGRGRRSLRTARLVQKAVLSTRE